MADTQHRRDMHCHVTPGVTDAGHRGRHLQSGSSLQVELGSLHFTQTETVTITTLEK